MLVVKTVQLGSDCSIQKAMIDPNQYSFGQKDKKYKDTLV